MIEKIPSHFFTKPSSSTGKYHPGDEQGEGGLALHSLRAKKAAEVLLKASVPPMLEDAVRMAALLHDVGRYGFADVASVYSLKNHAELGCDWVLAKRKVYVEANTLDPKTFDVFNGITSIAAQAILSHMGQWGKVLPESREDWLVHYADMIASQYTP